MYVWFWPTLCIRGSGQPYRNLCLAGARLYKFAREAGHSAYSQDELIERLATPGALPGRDK
jgi:hypothetical protein